MGNRGTGRPKARQPEAAEALGLIEQAAGVKLLNRGKLVHALRRVLLAYPEAGPVDLADCFRRMGQAAFWESRAPPYRVMKLPDEFPLYWKLRGEGRLEAFYPPGRGRALEAQDVPPGAEPPEEELDEEELRKAWRAKPKS